MEIKAIDAVCNLWRKEDMDGYPDHLQEFWKRIRLGGKFFEGVSVEELIELMDQSNIEKSLLLAAKGGEWEVSYKDVANAVEKYPDRFVGIAGIDPNTKMDGVKELEMLVKDFGFKGAHLYPHWFHEAPNHKIYYPFYAKCAELGVPIQIQVGHSAQRKLPTVARPITLDEIAIYFPELKLIGIHIGYPWVEEMISVSWKHEHVYIGSDAHAPKYWDQSFINYISTRGQDKVIFGTDFPIISFERAIKEIQELDIRPQALEKLLRNNVKKIYSL